MPLGICFSFFEIDAVFVFGIKAAIVLHSFFSPAYAQGSSRSILQCFFFLGDQICQELFSLDQLIDGLYHRCAPLLNRFDCGGLRTRPGRMRSILKLIVVDGGALSRGGG